MGFFSLFRKSSQSLTLLIDVGSASVGAALVSLNHGNIPAVHYTARTPINISGNSDSAQGIQALSLSLSSVLGRVQKALKVAPAGSVDSISVILAAPWCISRTKLIEIKEKEPVEVTKSFFDSLVRREEEAVNSELVESATSNLFKGESTLIEKRIIQTKLNGYPTADPYDKWSRMIETSIFIGIAPKEFLRLIEKIIDNFFHVRHTDFHSFVLASFSAVSDIFSSELDYGIMDVTGEATNLSFTRDGSLTESFVIPYGKHSLVRHLAQNLNVPTQVALSYLKLFAENNIESKLGKDIESFLADEKIEWQKALESSMKRQFSLPSSSKLFITADQEIAGAFWEFISSPNRETAKLSFTPVLLNSQALASFLSFSPKAAPDAVLSLEALYVNKLFSGE